MNRPPILVERNSVRTVRECRDRPGADNTVFRVEPTGITQAVDPVRRGLAWALSTTGDQRNTPIGVRLPSFVMTEAARIAERIWANTVLFSGSPVPDVQSG